jgi:predicted transcriptional regulator
MTKQKIALADFAKSPALKAHSIRSKAVARALDEQAESLPYSKVFTSFEFEDFLAQLTPKRFELLRIASKGRHSIADLAIASHRNPSAVSRDVSKLSELGLVKVESVNNEGHGQKKIVLPVANTISLSASIAAA